MRVTIAIDDISLPLPQMRRPDIRERMLNQVLQTLADYGVDDVHLVIATSLHRRMTESRDSPHRRRARVQAVLARPAVQLRCGESRRAGDARQDRSRRGSLAVAPRGGVRPAHLSQHQPRADGRRPQVGRGRTRAVSEPAPSPQRRHAARLALLHGPDAFGAASLVRPDGQADSRVGQHFSDRDRGQHSDVRRDAGFPAQERGPASPTGIARA